ncbi:hypothetical protein [Paraburkholderia sp. J11-2]|uniref:hypothetical protein n=1 Tax=Paraburkholderia sp. J11-2 TaxID=2805431 RepID=UPI002AB5E65E|nr:hypothetical protein [Paraburkholderia sp. J11-2]
MPGITLSRAFGVGRAARRLTWHALAATLLAIAGCHSAPFSAPTRVDLNAQPNAIAVRPGDGALFITDDRSNDILWSSNQSDFRPYASLPAIAGQPNSLSQFVFLRPDALLAQRFGFGKTGALFVVSAAGDAHALSGPASGRRRLGLVSIGPGRALSSWFIKRENEPPTGGVSLVSYDLTTYAATERDLVSGLAKPVGIAVHGGALFVADQGAGEILRYDLAELLAKPEPSHSGTAFAKIESPDLLAADASGALYTKCGAHGFCRITPDGTVSSLADDFQDARGVAVDETRHVVLVVDRAKGANATTSAIRAFALASSEASADH